MKDIEFVVYGKPTGKGRPRFSRTGHAYTDEKTRHYEHEVVSAYVEQFGNKKYFEDTDLRLSVSAHFEIPKSYTKEKRIRCETNAELPKKKPDCDNILKIIADALNGVAYTDDAQIVEMRCSKQYASYKPYVIVRLQEVDKWTR